MSRARDLLESSFVEMKVAGPLRTRSRPVRGGWSVGHVSVTGGTLGCLVKSDDGSLHVLSAGFVLAPPGATAGDAIIQPALVDGGRDPDDRVAVLSRYFRPADNGMDAAIATLVDNSVASGEIEGVGYLSGVADPVMDAEVVKVGRTTGLTVGKITKVATSVTVGYGPELGKQTLRGVFLINRMSSGGDGGAVVVDGQRRAIGLLIGGGTGHSIALPIRPILKAFEVELVTATVQ